jgi:hypothetical protein
MQAELAHGDLPERPNEARCLLRRVKNSWQICGRIGGKTLLLGHR